MIQRATLDLLPLRRECLLIALGSSNHYPGGFAPGGSPIFPVWMQVNQFCGLRHPKSFSPVTLSSSSIASKTVFCEIIFLAALVQGFAVRHHEIPTLSLMTKLQKKRLRPTEQRRQSSSLVNGTNWGGLMQTLNKTAACNSKVETAR